MTYHPKSDFMTAIMERGFLADCTDLQSLDETFHKGTVTGYIGFDLTATSLHIGNLVQIMLLRWMQKTGHRPITLMGGGTTKVGDPSGKDEMRKILGEIRSGEFAEEWIAENEAGRPNYQRLREQIADHQIEKVGAELRAMMPWISAGKQSVQDASGG